MTDASRVEDTADDRYETPELSDYGSIEEWTQGSLAQGIHISVII